MSTIDIRRNCLNSVLGYDATRLHSLEELHFTTCKVKIDFLRV